MGKQLGSEGCEAITALQQTDSKMAVGKQKKQQNSKKKHGKVLTNEQ